jgi:ferredoxin
MSVSITFEPSGISGLVAQGTYLVDAARRMGAPLGVGCSAGKGECPACLVSVKSGAELLSTPSSVEERLLGVDGLAEALRLACQAKIESSGEIVVMVSARRTSDPVTEPAVDLQKKFSELTLNKKIAALLAFEAITMSEAFDAAIQKPLSVGTRALDAIIARTRAAKSNDSPKQ